MDKKGSKESVQESGESLQNETERVYQTVLERTRGNVLVAALSAKWWELTQLKQFPSN